MAKKTIKGQSVAELRKALKGLRDDDWIEFEIQVEMPDPIEEFDTLLTDELRPIAYRAYEALKMLNNRLNKELKSTDVQRFIANHIKRNSEDAQQKYKRKNGMGNLVCRMTAAMHHRQFFAADVSVDKLAHYLMPAVGYENYETLRRYIYNALQDIRKEV